MSNLDRVIQVLSVQGVEVWTAWINVAISMCVIFVCTCRGAKMNRHVLVRVKASYFFLIVGSFTNAVSPGLGEIPGWGAITLISSVLVMLVADTFQWRHGPPEAATDRAPLEDF